MEFPVDYKKDNLKDWYENSAKSRLKKILKSPAG